MVTELVRDPVWLLGGTTGATHRPSRTNSNIVVWVEAFDANHSMELLYRVPEDFENSHRVSC